MIASGNARSWAVMGTSVTIHVGGDDADTTLAATRTEAIDRAARWFFLVEECCSRFLPDSELSQLSSRIASPVRVSEMLYQAVDFALAIAEESDGAFDPTMGLDMEGRGFNREHASGRLVSTPVSAPCDVSYRDVRVDPDARTITLRRPLLLDLGAVAKGLAIDLAARELATFGSFAIDAGGDLFLGGRRHDGGPWKVGIRHPRGEAEFLDVVCVSDRAVCTSGDYERRSRSGAHILRPAAKMPVTDVASVTVIAATAMLADALATAAFVLGPERGIALLEQHDVEGLLVTPALERYETRGFRSEYSILQDAQGAADDYPGDPAGAGNAGRGHAAVSGRPR